MPTRHWSKLELARFDGKSQVWKALDQILHGDSSLHQGELTT